MKKKLLSIILVIAMLACMIPLGMVTVFAESEPHTHEAGDEWMTDGRAHWLKCADENCPLNKAEDSVVEYEIAFSSYEGDALKTALSYSDKAEKSLLMGRQGRVISGNTESKTDGRTIIGLTQEQLASIGSKLIIVGSDDSDNNKQVTVTVDCAYTWFYDLVDGQEEKITAEDNNCAAFVIFGSDDVDGDLTGYGYYRVYNGTVSEDTLIGDALLAAPRTFKAVYDTTGNANTLNFYFDDKDHSGDNKTVYENGTEQPIFGDYWLYPHFEVKSVSIDPTVIKYKGLTTTLEMFCDMEHVESFIGAQYLDVSEVTDMQNMFHNFGLWSNSLTVPDVSKWNTGNVTNMRAMFYGYGWGSTALAQVPDVSNWNTENVTDMSDMFYGYGGDSTALTQVPDVSKWNTENVTTVRSMFSDYGNTSTVLDFTLDFSGWDLSNATTGEGMFDGAGYSTNTWKVTIPKTTKGYTNDSGHWLLTEIEREEDGEEMPFDGNIRPCDGKQFTVAN